MGAVRFCVLMALSFAITGCAARQAGPTAGQTFEAAVGVLSTTGLNHERVDWASVRQELAHTFAAEDPPAAAHSAIIAAVAKLNDPHARFIPPAKPSPPVAAQARSAPPSKAEPAANQVPTFPSVTVLDDGVAYVIVPMCSGPDVDSLRRYANALRSAILDSNGKHPKSWLIELRFNGGGNVWPMLIGLRPLLGDGVAFTSVINQDVTQGFGCDGEAAWLQEKGQRVEQLRIDAPPGDRVIPNPKIAVLTGPWTMSSGECITLALRGKGRAFGDATAGLTTVTNYYPLPDGSVLNLPVYLMADRNGHAPDGPIAPDIAVDCKDWPSAVDAQARKARAWLAEP